MNYLPILLLTILLTSTVSTAQAGRDVHGELQDIKKQRQLVQKAQQSLAAELGEVGRSLKKLDINLLQARKAYRSVRKQITAVDNHLAEIATEKEALKKRLLKLQQSMIKEASVAYQHSASQSVWVDVLSDTSVTEIPHRQFLLKQVLLSQENDRKAWRKTMAELAVLEKDEQSNKDKLLVLQQERKAVEQQLVSEVAAKRDAAKQLRSSIDKQKAQEKRLIRQEAALQRLLSGLGDTLSASDKRSKVTSIRHKKGRLPMPLEGRILLGFGKQSESGKTLAGIHLSPRKRTEEGKSVRAFAQGQVRYADWFGGYGLMMIVDYGQGIMAVYAHNDILHKQLGDWVEENEILAEAGSTGWIEDIRLYFEIRDKGKPVNPTLWCKK